MPHSPRPCLWTVSVCVCVYVRTQTRVCGHECVPVRKQLSHSAITCYTAEIDHFCSHHLSPFTILLDRSVSDISPRVFRTPVRHIHLPLHLCSTGRVKGASFPSEPEETMGFSHIWNHLGSFRQSAFKSNKNKPLRLLFMDLNTQNFHCNSLYTVSAL